MLEHYSHIRIDAKRQALDALDEQASGMRQNRKPAMMMTLIYRLISRSTR